MPDPSERRNTITAEVPPWVQRGLNLWAAYFGLRKRDAIATALKEWFTSSARRHPDGPKVKAVKP